jgi:hypothetical protein
LIYSKYFALTLKDIDRGFAGDDPRDDAGRAAARTIARELLGCKERLTTKDRAVRYEILALVAPDVVEGWLDEYFTREVIRKIPKMVERAMRLSNLGVEKSPPEQLNAYLQEATKCFVLGLPQAAIALCRAALEQGLRESVRRAGVSPVGELSELIEIAVRSKVLRGASLQLANDVRLAGNRALHYGSLTDKNASDVLLKVRLVLMDLFGAVDLVTEIGKFAGKQEDQKASD